MSLASDIAKGLSAGAGEANPVTAVADLLKGVLDRVVQDPNAKAAAQLEMAKLQQTGELAQLTADTQLALAQIGVNKADADSRVWWQAGWRPYAGWVCGSGLAYQLVFRPMLGWIMQNLFHWSMPPDLDVQTLGSILFGLLGLGYYRTREKLNGAAQ